VTACEPITQQSATSVSVEQVDQAALRGGKLEIHQYWGIADRNQQWRSRLFAPGPSRSANNYQDIVHSLDCHVLRSLFQRRRVFVESASERAAQWSYPESTPTREDEGRNRPRLSRPLKHW